MDWDKLKIFHTVAEASSFTKAATILNLRRGSDAFENTLELFKHDEYITQMITHKYSLNDIQLAFNNASKYLNNSIKTIIECQNLFYLVNSGGVIAIASEINGTEDSLQEQLDKISDRLTPVLTESKKNNESTDTVSRRIAWDRVNAS